MQDKITIVVGFDQREAIAYHTFCQSALEKTTLPIQFMPLIKSSIAQYKELHVDGSNDFIYSRFLTPFLMNFKGWAIFADGDMICLSDLAQLWELRDKNKAVQVVKHNYESKAKIKYLGNKNENYPRKNWSSLILWNCAHPANRVLTPQFISNSTGSFLHRFSWLTDELIGELPNEWNWLDIEYPFNPNAKLVHFTLGTPCFKEYSKTISAKDWFITHRRLSEGFD